jgi:hypothetical protein
MSAEPNNVPSYIEKLPDWNVDIRKSLVLLRFMDSLNRAEWIDLFRDLATRPSYVSSNFALKTGEDIVPYLACYLEQSGLPTKQNAARSLDALVVECLAHPSSEELTETIQTYFFLAKILQEGIRPNILQAVVNNKSFSREVRRDSAAVLANLREPLPNEFWLGLDFLDSPYLAPAAIAAIGEIHPLLALDLLSKLAVVEEQKPDELEELILALKYPVRATLKSIHRLPNIIELLPSVRNMVEGLSPRLRDLVSKLKPYKDFSSIADIREGAVRTITRDTARSAWQELVNNVISTSKLPYYYTGYQQGNIFRRDQAIDESDIEREFLSAIREEIKKYAKQPDIEITFNRLEIYSLDRLVKHLVEGQVLMPEVGYGTKARGEKASLIRVGQIERLAALVPFHLQKKFQTNLDIDVGRVGKQLVQRNYPLLEKVIDFCVDEKIQWINQPNSAVADISGDLFDKNMLKPGRTNVPFAFPGGVEDPDWIRIMVTPKNKWDRPRHIALLDYLTALGIKRKSRGNKLEIYSIKYNTPLPVGYFTPKGDTEFLRYVWNAVHKVLFDEHRGAWNNDFEKLMTKSDIVLDSRPSVQMYDPLLSGWQAADFLLDEIADIA